MINFTKDIETFIHDKNKKLEIVFGLIPNRYGLSLKIFLTKNKVKFSRDLVDYDTGEKFEGYYKDLYVYNFAYRQAGLEKFYWIRNRTDIRLSLDGEAQKYILENYDMTLKELDKFIEKYEPERII